METQISSSSPAQCGIVKFYCGSRIPQYFSAFVLNLSVMSVGTVISWPATALPYINNNQSTFPPLSSGQLAWVASVGSLGGLAVCPLGGYLMEKLGLRRSMLVLALPMILGWLIITFSTSFWILLLGRIITGFCSGGMSLATPAFIAETSSVEIRGMLGYSFDIMCSFGELYIFFIGSLVGWKWQSVACGIIPLIFYFLIMLIPESPRVLISKNKMEEAKKSLAWFRHASSHNLIEQEFNSILEDLQSDCSYETRGLLRDYFSAQVLKPTLVCVILMFFYNACGSSPVLTYTVQIFESANVGNSFLATVLVGLTQVVVVSASALFVDSLGRRVLLMVSAVGMAVCMSLLGAYLNFERNLGVRWDWLTIALLMLYIVLFSIGFGPIAWVYMGEVIPPGAKGYTSAMILASYRFWTFLVVYLFNDLVDWLGGEGNCFLLFGIISLLACAYVYLFVPETKQKTLAEIQLLFGISSKLDKNHYSSTD